MTLDPVFPCALWNVLSRLRAHSLNHSFPRSFSPGRYTHTVNETLAMATELHYSPAIKESLFKVAYMMTLKKAKFRGEIESTGVIRYATAAFQI